MSNQLTMKVGVAIFAALALVGALTMFVFGSVYPVEASGHSATRSFDPATVAPGGTVTVTVSAENYGRFGRVTETLPTGFTYESSNLDADQVITDGQEARFTLFGDDSFTYDVTAPMTEGEHTFSGMFVDSNQENVAVGGATTVTVATEPPPPVAKVELSPGNKAGADVTIIIRAEAGASIRGGTDIEVSLEDFGIPSSIDDSDVILDGGAGSYYGNPEDVSVSGETITITLPTRVSGTNEEAVISGSYSIRFKSAAGLSNPTSAGDKEIKVSDADATDETATVTIDKTVSVKPTFVTRGGDATVTAKGLRDGTTTVYLMDGDARGKVLGSGTADDGVVEIEIDTSGTALDADATADGDKDVGTNTLSVVDASNEEVGTTMLGVKPTVKLTSDSVKRSTSLEISVSDWYYGDIERVTVGGIEVDETEGDKTISVGSDMKETFKVTVPSNVRTVDQEVKVYGDNDELNTTSATAEVSVVVRPLNISPSTVVPGHRVTITGSGFASSEDVTSIMIGGKPVDVPTDADSTSSGRVAVTVTVPLNVGDGDKTVELTVTDDDDQSRTGEGEITVPKPEIELSPSTSVPGSVISVTGSGFAADGRVEVRFAGDIEEVGRADGSGDIHIRLEIPSDAGVGATNEVKVDTRNPLEEGDDDYVAFTISAKAEHKTPGPMITVPETAQVGTLAAISGTNFEPFTSLEVMIGGKDATPTGAETDKNGGFEIEARVPRLSSGSHTITVEDGSTDTNSVTETFEVVTTPVVSTPQEVFGGLGDNLVVVWRYDNATATWASYSPGAPAELNDLTGISRGDIVWIQVTADAEFQGQTLYLGQTGWNLITLE